MVCAVVQLAHTQLHIANGSSGAVGRKEWVGWWAVPKKKRRRRRRENS